MRTPCRRTVIPVPRKRPSADPAAVTAIARPAVADPRASAESAFVETGRAMAAAYESANDAFLTFRDALHRLLVLESAARRYGRVGPLNDRAIRIEEKLGAIVELPYKITTPYRDLCGALGLDAALPPHFAAPFSLDDWTVHSAVRAHGLVPAAPAPEPDTPTEVESLCLEGETDPALLSPPTRPRPKAETAGTETGVLPGMEPGDSALDVLQRGRLLGSSGPDKGYFSVSQYALLGLTILANVPEMRVYPEDLLEAVRSAAEPHLREGDRIRNPNKERRWLKISRTGTGFLSRRGWVEDDPEVTGRLRITAAGITVLDRLLEGSHAR